MSSRRYLPPIDLQHNAQKDCGRGVLPFTKTNFHMPFPVSFLALIWRIQLVHRAALGISSFSRAPGAVEINCMTCSTLSCTP